MLSSKKLYRKLFENPAYSRLSFRFRYNTKFSITPIVPNSTQNWQAAKHYTNQFRWHLFSFELLPAVQGDQARTAFDEIKKGELYLFFDYADETYRVKNAHLLTANVNDARRD